MHRARHLAVAAVLLLAGCGIEDGPRRLMAGRTDGPGPTAPTAGVFPKPPTIAECLERLKKRCYSAGLLREAYGAAALGRAGTTGRGTTIAIFDFAGSPTAAKDLTTFSVASGLPAPDLTVHEQDLVKGPVAKFDPRDSAMVDTALETTLDLQAAHAMAPDAKLVLQQVNLPAPHWKRHREGHHGTHRAPGPSPERQAERADAVLTAEAEVVADAVREVVTETAADVISISYGYPEVQFGEQGAAALAALHPVFQQAADKGVTVLASTGDHGAAPPLGPGGRRVRTAQWPSTDPAVVAVGGTRLRLDQQGRRTSPDTVWDEWEGKQNWAGGGGQSRVFSRPAFQNGVRDLVGARRGVPDVALSAALDGGLLIYQSMVPDQPGWQPTGGTSEAAPLLAGLVALGVQRAGGRLGLITPAVYDLAAKKDPAIVDITEGRNGPDGDQARPGYDLASGWGTVDATRLVPALAGEAP